MTDCTHLLQQGIKTEQKKKTLSLQRATVADGVPKLDYTSVILVGNTDTEPISR